MRCNWNNNKNNNNQINPLKSRIYFDKLVNIATKSITAIKLNSIPIELNSVINNQSASAIGSKIFRVGSINSSYPPNM